MASGQGLTAKFREARFAASQCCSFSVLNPRMGSRARVHSFPDWTSCVGKMRETRDEGGDFAVTVSCTACDEGRLVDLEALCMEMGARFSLINRRARCRLTPGCRGWNRFFYQSGVMRPLWTEDQADAWIDIDNRPADVGPSPTHEAMLARSRAIMVASLRGELHRTDPAPPGIDQQAWATADDYQRRRLVRRARG